MTKYLLDISVLTLLLCISLGNSGTPLPTDSIEQVLSIPDSIYINDQVVKFDSYIWRDFMPGPALRETDLKIIIRIFMENAGYLPVGLDADSVWIIYQDELWGGELHTSNGQKLKTPQKTLKKKASGGPKWPPGSEVSVILKLIDREGNAFKIKKEHQQIQQTF
jgi:hypothetical protein